MNLLTGASLLALAKSIYYSKKLPSKYQVGLSNERYTNDIPKPILSVSKL